MKNKLFKISFAPILLSLIFLFNPNFNIIDILPDFVAYFILARAIGKKGEFIPYLSEARSGFIKLAILTLLKMPAVIVMYANASSGRDIIPLFTLVFSALELIFLIGTIDNCFSGLYYIGERSEADALILPFKVFRKSFKAETVKNATYIFLAAKAVLCFLPEICLLTVESIKTRALFNALYFPLLLTCVIITLALGILWLTLSVSYVNKVKNQGSAKCALEGLIGKEDILLIERKNRQKAVLNSLSLLGLSTVFLFDLRFSETGEVNILPHFLFAFVLLTIAFKLFESKAYKIFFGVSVALYSLSSVIFGIYNIRFLDSFSYRELSESYKNPAAAEAYKSVELLAALELVFFLVMTVAMACGFIRFIRNNTALHPSDPLYSKQDKDRHKTLYIKSIIAFGITAVIGALKCLNVYLKSEIVLIFGRNDIIFSNKAPWLSTLIFILVILLTVFFYGTCEDIKEDVEFKYKNLS